MNIIFLDTVSSTNDYIAEKINELTHGTVVFANKQTGGKGQAENKWFTKSGKNLTFSILYNLSAIDVKNLLSINKAVALSVYEFVSNSTEHKYNVRIKWPNDIIIDDKKISGILIENSICGAQIMSIIGIGININQITFPDMNIKPTSLKLLTNKTFDLKEILNEFLSIFKEKISVLSKDIGFINDSYNSQLFRRGEWYDYNFKNVCIKAKIIEVDADGLLILETGQGEKLSFKHGEIKYVY